MLGGTQTSGVRTRHPDALMTTSESVAAPAASPEMRRSGHAVRASGPEQKNAALEQATLLSTRKSKKSAIIPEMALVNPMAPAPAKKRGHPTKAKESPPAPGLSQQREGDFQRPIMFELPPGHDHLRSPPTQQSRSSIQPRSLPPSNPTQHRLTLPPDLQHPPSAAFQPLRLSHFRLCPPDIPGNPVIPNVLSDHESDPEDLYEGQDPTKDTDRDSQAEADEYEYDGPPAEQDYRWYQSTMEQGVPDIDEVSPDEDDHLAESNLQVPDPSQVNMDNTFDVLQQHHKRNRVPHPPNQQDLQYQHNRNNMNKEQESSASEEEHLKKRAKCHSQVPVGSCASPIHLRFYSGIWREIVEHGKLLYRHTLLSEDAFHDRLISLEEAAECRNEVFEIFQAQSLTEQLDMNFYAAHHKDIAICIYNEGATFRGELKILAMTLMPSWYGIFPDYRASEQQVRAHTRHVVKGLLDNSTYLRNGKDKEGRTNNFAHPMLQELVQAFFYRSKKNLAMHFPDTFENMVPVEAIALAATVIQHVLELFETGIQVPAQFCCSTYHPIYKDILSQIRNIEANPYHAAKLKKNRRAWANAGCIQSGLTNNAQAGSSRVTICLD